MIAPWLQPACYSDTYFNPQAHHLEQGEILFVVFLRKFYKQPFNAITLALQQVRCNTLDLINSFPSGNRSKVLPTALCPPDEHYTEKLYHGLSESAKGSNPCLRERGFLRDAPDFFHYWNLLLQHGQSPEKEDCVELWQGTLDAYLGLLAPYADKLTTTLPNNQALPNFGPGFRCIPVSLPPGFQPHPSQVLYQSPVDYLNDVFTPFDLDLIVSLRLQQGLDDRTIAQIIKSKRRNGPRDASNPYTRPGIVNPTKVRKAFDSFPRNHALKMKWSGEILPFNPGSYLFVGWGYMGQMNRGIDTNTMEARCMGGNIEEVD